MPRRSGASGNDVPFLHRKQIEREADLLLAEYAEIIEPVLEPPVPIEELVGTVLKLRHQFLDLKSRFPYADVHGAIWFEEALIGIDSSLNPDLSPRRRGRYHFTLAHEIGHWRLCTANTTSTTPPSGVYSTTARESRMSSAGPASARSRLNGRQTHLRRWC